MYAVETVLELYLEAASFPQASGMEKRIKRLKGNGEPSEKRLSPNFINEESGIGGLEHFLNHGKRWRGLGIESAECAHCEHEHVELHGHLHLSIIYDADIAPHGQSIGMTASVTAAGSHHIIDLFATVRDI